MENSFGIIKYTSPCQLGEVFTGEGHQQLELGQGGPGAPVQHQLPDHGGLTRPHRPVQHHVEAPGPAPICHRLKQLLHGAGRNRGALQQGAGDQGGPLLRGLPFQDEGVHVHGLWEEVAPELLLLLGQVAEPQLQLPLVDLDGVR